MGLAFIALEIVLELSHLVVVSLSINLRESFKLSLLVCWQIPPRLRNEQHHVLERRRWLLLHQLPLALLNELQVCMAPLLGLA